MRTQRDEFALIIALIVLLFIIYLPIIFNEPIGWTLYMTWTTAGLLAIMLGYIFGWGDRL